MGDSPRVLVIGAHPDDADYRTGGTTKLWVDHGCAVTYLSVTNGNAGHHQEGGARLAQRRAEEAKRAGDVLGIPYRLLEHDDGQLMPSLAARQEMIALIRDARPDLVLTHRPNDYHPDHRYTSQLVQDASFLITVPNIVPLTPPMDEQPVIGYLEDGFQKPYPFQPDMAVAIDDTVDVKADMLFEHTSQVFEWLARGLAVPDNEVGRRALIREQVRRRAAKTADRFRDRLVELYGPDRGRQIQYAEVYEVCEYGADLTPERRRRLFPFLPEVDAI